MGGVITLKNFVESMPEYEERNANNTEKLIKIAD